VRRGAVVDTWQSSAMLTVLDISEFFFSFFAKEFSRRRRRRRRVVMDLPLLVSSMGERELNKCIYIQYIRYIRHTRNLFHPSGARTFGEKRAKKTRQKGGGA
jgi:hypothetical protein